MSAADADVGGTRYRFEQRLASGGMADLFVAQALAAGGVRKRVAIKRVQPRHANDEEFVSMFLNEARLASTLQHTNIVQTYDVLQVRGEYFIVMELLEGVDLQEFLRLQAKQPEIPLRVGHVLYIVERCLSALHYAHERVGPDDRPLGITHRDVSPHNLYLTYDGGVKLLDFGIAKVQSLEKPTESNLLKGKVLYMAPEQCQAGAIDRRTDLYAVGVLMYRLLGGTFPHRGANAFDTMRAIIHQEPRPLAEISPNLPEELTAIVARALRKSPSERYQTAREMQLDIMQCIRTYGLFVADVEFAGLVEQIAPRDRFRPDADNRDPLPGDLVVGSGAAAPAAKDAPTDTDAADRAIVATDVALVERIHGVTVLRLRGAIDERLRPDQLTPHLDGEIIVDSEHVARITSYGIRSLISLFDGRRGDVYHVRVSSTYLEQVAMVRSLLGGGRVVSFHLPYVDPQTGNPFTELLEGEAAAKVLETGEPPLVTCPGFPDRKAEFDEDPDTYFAFARDFSAALPEHIAHVVELMKSDASKPVEKRVDADATTLRVLRPLSPAMRWSRVLRGIEGKLILDLERVPWWNDDGLTELSAELARVAGDLSSVELVGVPSEIYTWLKKKEALRGSRGVVSLRISSQCQRCETPRQVLVAANLVDGMTEGGLVPDESCPRCGGLLVVTGALPKLTAAPAAPRSTAPPRPGSIPPGSIPPGSIPPGSLPPGGLAPGGHPTGGQLPGGQPATAGLQHAGLSAGGPSAAPPPTTASAPHAMSITLPPQPSPAPAEGVPLYIWFAFGITALCLIASLLLLVVAIGWFL